MPAITQYESNYLEGLQAIIAIRKITIIKD